MAGVPVVRLKTIIYKSRMDIKPELDNFIMKTKRGLFLIILIITIRTGFAQKVQEEIEYPNLVKNGDFESGATGFKSDFIYTDTSFNPGYYTITENINRYGPDFLNPVPNTGKYYAINVNNSGKQRLWYDSITVKPNTKYSFSCILANVNAEFQHPGVMNLKVNRKKLLPSKVLPNGTPAWSPYSILYKTGPDETRIEISIVDEEWTLMGNDVALDNIVFKETLSEELHSNYSIQTSKSPLPLVLNQIVEKPFNKKYPISYSVIYRDRLITLFEQGKFICQSTLTFDRDTEFEKYLNTRKFQYHWLLDNKLVGLSNEQYYFLNTENIWVEYKNEVPFSNQPKLFEDNTYISFWDCNGQRDGTVYFFNKQTKKTHFTRTTCANSIIKRDNKYYVLSNIAKIEHSVINIGDLGSTYLKEISSPDNLPTVELKKINNNFEGQEWRYTHSSVVAKPIFSYYNIEIFASFIYNGRTIYLVNWKEKTFLAEIENSVINVVNPLFNNEFYYRNSVTTSYDNTVLINFGYNGITGAQEVYCIIIKDGKLTKLDWNENH
jgi:hypothetical protein